MSKILSATSDQRPATALPGRMVILSGPSGSGKTTIYKTILARPKLRRLLVRSVSATTRPRRPGEREGRDYFFLTQKEFLARRKKGCFLEWKKVFTNYYGTPLAPVKEFLKSGKNVLLAIDVQGAKMVWRRSPRALKIFVQTPSFAVLKQRLSGRGTENSAELAIRLKTAKAELREAKYYDYILINDSLSRCCAELEKILLAELSSTAIRYVERQ